MSDISLFYIATSSIDEAKLISKTLIEEKLAACVNIFPEVISIYQWEGAIEESKEVVLIGKTLTSSIAALQSRVKQLHSYETPSISSIKIDKLDGEYRKWIENSIK